MRKIISHEDGIFAVNLARKAVETYIKSQQKITPPATYPEDFREKSGVFVTLKTVSKEKGNIKKELRGCIGFPYPINPLIEAIIESAISSATEDSRFHPPFGPGPVTKEELNKITFEVSILTPPKLLEVKNPKEYLTKIKIGQDGLIAQRGTFRGLLLPQVPVEWKWDVKEYLEHTCNKAYLPTNCWEKLDTKIYTFQAIIFEEIEPLGEIKRKELNDE
ncbi:MAG TPA: TIGR00296 family protein [Candidatus Deferrimicrobium sp.]|nr:TIGR00296 family protein [Candidatus Deferrimicrobium sp.]